MHVEKDDIEVRFAEAGQRLDAVLGLDDPGLEGGKEEADDFSVERIVVDDEN